MSTDPAIILVTGATGKVGQAFLPRFLADPAFAQFKVRALCHNRLIPAQERVEVVRGDLSQRETAHACLQGVTHVIHMAHVKETPEQVMDVAVKGLFWLLEECRASETFQQFILIGGDNAVGHCIVPHAAPVTETMGHSPYPGCYALAKVLEEVMLEQYYVQYDLNGCCLRAPWIMEKDDFKQTLSFGEDVFGGPRWRDLVGAELADQYAQAGTVPILCDAEGRPSSATSCMSKISSAPSFMPSTTRRPGSRPSTSAWTSRWITARWPSICTGRAACPRSRCGPNAIRTGWTTRRPSSCSAGVRPMISRA